MTFTSFRLFGPLWAASCLLAGCAAMEEPPHPALEPYLGVYRGSFDSALTDDPGDDLNHNPCAPDSRTPCTRHHEPLADVLLALRRTRDGDVSLAFYRDREALVTDEALDLLGAGCGTRLGRVESVEPMDEPAGGGHVAVFPLTADNRSCLGKLRPVSRHRVRLELEAVSSTESPRAVRAIIDKSVRDANYLYVVEDGVRRRVRIDLDNSVREDHDLRYRVCIEDDLGEYQRCVVTDRRFRSFALPVPVPGGVGVNYTWWEELQPKLRRTEGRYAVERYVGRFEALDSAPAS